MNNQRIIKIQNIKIIITIINQNLLLLILITKKGIFYKILYKYSTYLLNLQEKVFIKETINNKNLTIYQTFLLKNIFTLFYYTRYYLKLKGLGFSFKYLSLPKHILLLNIGFSKVRYIKIPTKIFIIKKPRKKKYIFTLISSDINLLNSFVTIIRSLKIPDPYKLKGFRFIQENITTKVGKKKK